MTMKEQMDPKQQISTSQAFTARVNGVIRSDLNDLIKKSPHDEVLVADKPSDFTPKALTAFHILDRSPDIGLILVEGPERFVVVRKACFESAGGFVLNSQNPNIFEDLYTRLLQRREWTVLKKCQF